ncbi:S9 family peptidase [Rudaea cellulosilytica]|uniref:S9 family peptidase n=1 Tax=Rudaea cellulosilytica TaxID=540746 RepID=UPI00039CBE08|nr:prolyl oligopeptidase family serine peptidase [Rudaea cellulosilytica]
MSKVENRGWSRPAILAFCLGALLNGADAIAASGKTESTRAYPYELAFQMRELRRSDLYTASPDGTRVAAVVLMRPDEREQSVRFLENGSPIDAQGAHILVSSAGERPTPDHAPICGGKGNQWSPVWSPDGRRLAFYSDIDGSPRVWVMETNGGACRRVSDAVVRTSLFAGYQAHWSPDGHTLFVPLRPEQAGAVRDSERLSTAESDAQHDAKKPPAVFYSGSEQPKESKTNGAKSGDDLAFFLAHYNSTLASIDVESGATKVVVDAREEPRPATLEVSPSGHWLTHTSVSRRKEEISTVYVKDLSFIPAVGGKSRLLVGGMVSSESPINYTELDYRWHPTQDRLVYLNDGAAWSVDFTDAGPSTPRRLAPELGKVGGVILYFSRDGKSLLVGLDAKQEGRNTVPKSLAVIPLDGGKASTYALPDTMRWQFLDVVRANDDVLWQPRANEISFLERDRTTAEETVFSLDLVSGKTRAMNTGLHQLNHFASGGDHKQLFAIFEDIATPPDVYRYSADLSSKSRVTMVEPRVEGLLTSVPKVLQARVPMYDGSLKTVRTTLLLPPGAKQGDKVPAIVMIYSGSDLSTRATYYGGGMGNTVPSQIFTSRGYAVLMADVELAPEGEPSYPLQHMVDILLPQVYAAANEGYIDINRLAVSGQSYGGYSTASIASVTNVFRAAIPVNGTYDLASFYGGLDKQGNSHWIRWAEQGQGRMGQSPWANLQRYIDNSPFYRIDRIHTPLLIVSGGADETCPTDGARFFFVGLRRLERPAELLIYPGEGHVISEWSVGHAADVSRRMVEFLGKHLDKSE